jgi:hypothetical protein
MKTIPFKPAAEQWVKGPGRDPETRTDGNVISWPMSAAALVMGMGSLSAIIAWRRLAVAS